MLTKAELSQMGMSVIGLILEATGELRSGVLIASRKDKPTFFSIAAPDVTTKNAKQEIIISKIQKMRHDGTLTGVVFLGETWIATDDKAPPSQHPDRKEAVTMAVYGSDGKELYFWPIERHGNAVKRGVQEILHTEEWKGWTRHSLTKAELRKLTLSSDLPGIKASAPALRWCPNLRVNPTLYTSQTAAECLIIPSPNQT